MLFLVHHAQAADALVDTQRPLTLEGRVHADDLARRAHARGAKPEVIWHSGKLRARQTAEAMWRACNPLAELAAARGLQPDDPPLWMRDSVEGDQRDIMLVGHMPHMARLYRLLIGESTAHAAAEFPLHGAVALSMRGERWQEAWREK